ncbi:MAG: hypothetical protein AAF483_31110, partial [Planctomycetota bacterium]
IDLRLENQSLRLALDLICRQLELTWQIKNGILELTTQDSLAIETAVFDVRDLCRNTEESNALLDAVIQQTSPDEWFDNGGEGEIRFAKPGVMVVYQTQKRHDDVLTLLENYRFALRASKPREAEEKSEVTTRYYRMPTQVAKELSEKFKELVASESWKSEMQPDAIGTITSLQSWGELETAQSNGKDLVAMTPYSVLVIKQTTDVHIKLAEMLHWIRFGQQNESGGMFGGGKGGMGGMGGFGGGFFRIPPEAKK